MRNLGRLNEGSDESVLISANALGLLASYSGRADTAHYTRSSRDGQPIQRTNYVIQRIDTENESPLAEGRQKNRKLASHWLLKNKLIFNCNFVMYMVAHNKMADYVLLNTMLPSETNVNIKGGNIFKIQNALRSSEIW
jgi:hypothetical protein